jgi:hypothetical protein
MRAFAEKTRPAQPITCRRSALPPRARFRQSREVRSILHPPAAPGPAKILQAKLTVGSAAGVHEQEAERVAEQVMRMPEPRLQRACSCGGRCAECQAGEPHPEGESLQRQRAAPDDLAREPVPPVVHAALRSPAEPLNPATRAFMETRFGRDFSRVRVHTGPLAERSAKAVRAQAYTVGSDVVFGAGRYAPANREGQRLLAHELVHVVQQSASSPSLSVAQRQPEEGVDPDLVAEREYGGSGAPKAQKCGRPSWCPAGFCDPYRSEKLAEYYRSKKAWWLMAGISAAVDSRVVPLWREYLWGGASTKNLTADFGKDFTKSPTTKKATTFLYDALKKSLAAAPPSVPLYGTTTIDLGTQIPKAVAELDDPASSNQMNFNIPKDIPGNLAGGIGKDQTACPAGAKPSPFNDERQAKGAISVTRLAAGELTVTPLISYTVKDTIDLCPGDCGTPLEQVATIPLSQFEATGISGDVPFTVDFPAPFLGQLKVTAPLPATPSPAPSPKKP